MPEVVRFRRHNNTDLNMYQCGHEDCLPGHSYGPAVRDHYLIHYIHSGKGIFQVGDKTYHLSKGHGFLICPEIITYYQADFEEPWSYSWVGFHGLKAESYLSQGGLTEYKPIFKYEKDDFISNCFNQMLATNELVKGREIRLLAQLYMFLSQLIEVSLDDHHLEINGNRKEMYIKKAVEFIEMNYSRRISVEDISNYVGLDRSYLGSLFKEVLKISIQQYLINFRINRACELMKNVNLTIGDVSRSVGYEDPLLFSKIFRKTKGIPPRGYRKTATDIINPDP
mgnify:CR=1 FL=1